MLAVILMFFGCYNLVWFVTKYHPYHEFCNDMQSIKVEEISKYYIKDDKYTYIVKMPAYLGFGGGFLNVSYSESPKIVLNEDGKKELLVDNANITLFAWPNFTKETEYGVMIVEGQTMTQLYINENLDYVPFDYETIAEISEHEQIIMNHYQQISELMNAMKKMWGEKL